MAKIALSSLIYLFASFGFLSSIAHATSEEERLWQLLEQQPNSGVVWAELALLYCQQGRFQPAKRVADYLLVQENTPQSIKQLMQAVAQGECYLASQSETLTELSLTTGHDSNANLGATSDEVVLTIDSVPVSLKLAQNQLAKSAFFRQIGLNYQYRSAKDWSFGVSATNRSYWDVPQFDQSFLSLNVQTKLMNLHPNFSVSQFWVGGQSLWQQAAVSNLYKLNDVVSLDGRISLQFYPDQPLYNSQLMQLGLRHIFSHSSHFMQLKYGVQLDFPVDALRPGGNKQGGYMGLDYGYQLAKDVSVQLNAHWLRMFDSEPYSSLLGNQRREQDAIQLGTAINYALSQSLLCSLSVFHQRNQTNLPLFGYEQTIETLGCRFQF